MLEKFTFNTMPIESILYYLNNEKIIINKDYQRNYLKENDKKFSSLLIDSIVNNIPIGAIYIAGSLKLTMTHKNYKSELLDGQQRLVTIQRFINNEYELSYIKSYYNENDNNEILKNYSNNNNNNKYFLQVYKGKRYKDLPKEIQSRINNYELLIVNYMAPYNNLNYKEASNYNKKAYVTLFQRMNTLGTKLTKSEIEYAKKNILDKLPNVDKLAFKLSEDKYIPPNKIFKKFSQNKINKKEHFTYYKNLVVVIVDEILKPYNLNEITTITKYNEYFNSLEEEEFNKVYTQLHRTISITNMIFDNIGDNGKGGINQGLFQLQIGTMIRILDNKEINIDWINISKVITNNIQEIYFEFLKTNSKITARLQPKVNRSIRQSYIEKLTNEFKNYLLTLGIE